MNKAIIESVTRLDLFVWVLVVGFFCGSSLIFDGNLQLSFLGASGIILEMLFISISIEIIIDTLKDTKGIGTITGFITNGPEALCLIVGLLVGDVIFAASTPLGSNFMNPILLLIAAAITFKLIPLLRCQPLYTWLTIIVTASFAIAFFMIDKAYYPYWLIAVSIITITLFIKRPEEPVAEDQNDEKSSKALLIPALIILTLSGYFLDPVVSFAAQHSQTPKGVIGFVVLATLTSWPEFKSCLSLLQRGKILGAVLNITVSNITNIWLAAIGVTAYLFI